MDLNDLLLEVSGRVDEHVRNAVSGLDVVQLTTAPGDGANPIGWIVWHLTRVQDDHVADLVDDAQVWVTEDWGPRFGVESDPHDTGWSHSPEQVAAIRPDSAQALVDYYDATVARTRKLLRTVTPDDLDRIVDTRWDPPVTMGVRLVSVLDDEIQHAGQAMYVRGLLGY